MIDMTRTFLTHLVGSPGDRTNREHHLLHQPGQRAVWLSEPDLLSRLSRVPDSPEHGRHACPVVATPPPPSASPRRDPLPSNGRGERIPPALPRGRSYDRARPCRNGPGRSVGGSSSTQHGNDRRTPLPAIMLPAVAGEVSCASPDDSGSSDDVNQVVATRTSDVRTSIPPRFEDRWGIPRHQARTPPHSI